MGMAIPLWGHHLGLIQDPHDKHRQTQTPEQGQQMAAQTVSQCTAEVSWSHSRQRMKSCVPAVAWPTHTNIKYTEK